MVSGARTINPRTLSDRELVKYFAVIVDEADEEQIPKKWAVEVLRRLVKYTNGDRSE